jgi:hypothetical protein
MAMTKIKDLAVKTGEYTVNGETKGRYENVGAVMQGDNGKFIMLKRTFNPAGVPNPDGRDSVLISMFDVKDAQGNKPAAAPAPRAPAQTADDDIPF